MIYQLESEEDYLERILMLNIRNGSVRSIDIANDMNYSKASVSIAMKKLKNKELIVVGNNGEISLTEEGYKTASKIYERHKVLTKMLNYMGVPKTQAEIDACKIEHDVSDETYQALKEHLLKENILKKEDLLK